MQDKFNLLNEKWIPLQGDGLASLRDVFSDKQLPNLSGNPIEKISLMKFLLAIAHAACTPKDYSDWENLTLKGLANNVTNYLKDKDKFFNLYGDTPFLQIPAVSKAKKKNISILQPYIVPDPSSDSESTNTTVLTEIQREIKFSNAEKAVLLIQTLNFALGSKKVDNKIVLTSGYNKKTDTGKPGYSLGKSYLHTMVLGKTLLESIYLNLLTEEEIFSIKTIKEIGEPPWEVPPTGEDCPVAKRLKESYIGMLVPFSRFMLISGDYVHYTEGFYPNEYDLSICRKNNSKGGLDIIKADPEKKPWRELVSLLSFIETNTNSINSYDTPLLRFSIEKIKKSQKIEGFTIYSGGLKVSSNAGEFFVTGNCDFVESEVLLKVNWLGEEWFNKLKIQLKELERNAQILETKVKNFHKEFKISNPKSIAKKAVNMFWQKCENEFVNLLNALGENKDLNNIQNKFSSYVYECYDDFCPNITARQMETWIKHRNFKTKKER